MNDSLKDRIASGVVVANSLTSTGFGIVGLAIEPGNVYALYAAARTLPIAAIVIGTVVTRGRLVTLAVLLALIQGCDALVGIAEHDAIKTIGPLVFAIATAFAALRLKRTP